MIDRLWISIVISLQKLKEVRMNILAAILGVVIFLIVFIVAVFVPIGILIWMSGKNLWVSNKRHGLWRIADVLSGIAFWLILNELPFSKHPQHMNSWSM